MKYLVVLLNNTDDVIHFINTEHSGDNQSLAARDAFRTKVHFDIPDNSESSRYFDEHHMEILDSNNQPLFSFWSDDDNDYKLKCCKKRDWQNTIDIPGYSDGGNYATVGIILNEDNTLRSFRVMNDV